MRARKVSRMSIESDACRSLGVVGPCPFEAKYDFPEGMATSPGQTNFHSCPVLKVNLDQDIPIKSDMLFVR